ncbi:MAG: orotate phosphoribosyltransferase [Caldisphaeraceae archaeon]|nr:orotate phosphoribosyltransferase [Caldisphaeraceae archaeon]
MQEVDLISRLLYKTGSVKIGDFLLASGKTSRIYIDMRNMLAYPDGFKAIGEMLINKLREISRKDIIIVGVATGGIPWASIASYSLGLPMSYFRPKKEHGLKKRLEGIDIKGRECIVLDDVSTTGGSIMETIGFIRENGGSVKESIVIIDRAQGAEENLRKEGVSLRYLFSLKDIIVSLKKQGFLNEETFKSLWLDLYGGEGFVEG